jgi:hypothetical protein
MSTEELLQQLESLVGSDDFEFDSEEIMEQIAQTGAGGEIIPALLGIMERHPLEDFGMPGALVHFIERHHPDHIPHLLASLRRQPAMHTVWMLNRCINGGDHKEQYLSILQEIAGNPALDPAIRNAAQDFVDFQLHG